MNSHCKLTLDGIVIAVSNGRTFAGREVANILRHGGPLAIARRLVALAAQAEPQLRDALLELAHQVEPGPIPETMATRGRIKVNRQPDHSAPAGDDPGRDVWGPDMADCIGERWLRRQLADPGHAS